MVVKEICHWNFMLKMAKNKCIYLLFIIVISSCVTSPFRKPDYDFIHSTNTFILKVPFIEQDNKSTCGYAALLMVMKYWGIDKELKYLEHKYPLSKNGLSGHELMNVAKNEGFKSVIYKSNRDDLYKHIRDTRPIIVMIGSEKKRHYVVVCGWSIDEKIFVMDPLKGLLYIDYVDFSRMWDASNNFAMIVIKEL
jgi:ABC-type bacteriocin/lantibiotic exporter with double-glycine peptidase domain